MRAVSVSVLGLGKVGRAVLASLDRNHALFASKYALDVRVHAVADSRGVAVAKEAGFVSSVLALKQSGTSVSAHPGHVTGSILDLVPPESILVDCTASAETGSILVRFLFCFCVCFCFLLLFIDIIIIKRN